MQDNVLRIHVTRLVCYVRVSAYPADRKGESQLVHLVHSMGLRTRAGTRVWVGRVRVRVGFEVPAQTHTRGNGFGGFRHLPVLM
jgi:hypothetical protein